MTDGRIVHVKRGVDGDWYWNESVPKVGGKPGEREIVADGSEGYHHQEDCVNEARKVTGIEPVVVDFASGADPGP